MLTLIQFNPEERSKPQAYHVKGGQKQTLGRRRGPVPLTDTRISRRHAEVSIQNNVWVIRDLESSNGTWVNGERIAGLCELEEGDRLVIGRTTLIVGHAEVTEQDLSASSIGSDTADPPTEPRDLDAPASLDQSFAAHDSALAAPADSEADAGADDPLDESDFDLDIDLGLDDISLDMDDDASAGDPIAFEDDRDDATGDRVDLEAEAMSNQASSLAPAMGGSAVAADVPTDEPHLPEARGSIDDDAAAADEYAGVDEFVPPLRPDSPLDVSADGDDQLGGSSMDGSDLAFDDGEQDDDDTPPRVGLSLEMPAPDQIDSGLSEHEAEGQVDVIAEAELADSDDEPELQQPSDAVHEQTPSDSGSGADADQVEADPSSKARQDDERGIDLIEPEQSPDDLAYASRPRRGWGKLAAAAVLLLGVGGVAFWAMQGSDTATPIAGAPGATRPALETPGAADTSPTPGQPPRLATRATSDERGSAGSQTGATPSAGTPAASSSDASDTAGNRPADKPNPFGQATTLTPEPTTATANRPAPETPSGSAPGSTPDSPTTPTVAPESMDRTAERPTALPPATGLTPANPTADAATAADAESPLAMITPPTPTDPSAAATTPRTATEPSPSPAAVVAGRRIVFVVDASGSMVDSMNQGALSWLEQYLAELSETDRFTVLFFRSNEVIEVPPLGLKDNGSAARQNMLAWASPSAGNVQPRGKSEPIDALKKAKQYQPSDIYILSDDKFGQRSNSASVDARDLESFLGGLPVTVHTVQFFYPNRDDSRLEQIARHFGGTYEFVEEPPFDLNDNAPDMDLIGLSR